MKINCKINERLNKSMVNLFSCLVRQHGGGQLTGRKTEENGRVGKRTGLQNLKWQDLSQGRPYEPDGTKE